MTTVSGGLSSMQAALLQANPMQKRRRYSTPRATADAARYAAGLIFAFSLNKFVGSYLFFNANKRGKLFW